MKTSKKSKNKPYEPKYLGNHGDLIMPDIMGRCGKCGFSNFDFSNGMERSKDGVRGYRCFNCKQIKPENWRELTKKYSPGDLVQSSDTPRFCQ